MWIEILFVSLAALGKDANGFDCGSMKFKSLENSRAKNETSRVCYEERTQAFISEKCYRGRECGILKKATRGIASLASNAGPVGNPSHLACHAIGGRPEIVDVIWKKRALGTHSRCISGDDRSFIDTVSLLRLKD